MILKVSSVLLIALFTFTSSASAEKHERISIRSHSNPSAPQLEFVNWVGEVKGEASLDASDHVHELKFVRRDDGKEFSIKDSPELMKRHRDTEKNFMAEIEAEKTPRFLFWGGNLIVNSFKVIEETNSAPHLEKFDREPTRVREPKNRL